MSERELRGILNQVMAEIDAGRLRPPGPGRGWRRALAPPLLAASLGLAAVGCGDRAVGVDQDGDVPADAHAPRDGRPDVHYVPWDAGVDAALALDAEVDDDAEVDIDAQVDAGDIPVYMSPPPIEP